MDDIEMARWLSSPESRQVVEPTQEPTMLGSGRGRIAPKPMRGTTLVQHIAQQQAEAMEMIKHQCGIVSEAEAARINAMYRENAPPPMADALIGQQQANLAQTSIARMSVAGPFSPERIQARVDAVLPEGCLQFDGPPTAHVFGSVYTTLGSAGPVAEGAAHWCGNDAEEVLAMYLEQLRAFCEGATQVAWRRRTTVDAEQSFEFNCTRYKVTGRLAVWR